MDHVISFRRPGQTRLLTKLTVPSHEDAAAYVRRLENLGYAVVDVVPPVSCQGPPQNPRRDASEVRVVSEAGSSLEPI